MTKTSDDHSHSKVRMANHGKPESRDDDGNDVSFMPTDHALPSDLEPNDVAITVLNEASACVRASAKVHPPKKASARTVVGLVFEDDGSLALDEGLPIVMSLPVQYHTDSKKLSLIDAPNRMVSIKEAAKQLGISVSTLQRARYSGLVEDPKEISSRRVGWLQSYLFPIVAAGGLHEYVKAKTKAKAGK